MSALNYIELPPPAWLSNSVEVFWCRKLSHRVLFLPQGVFDLIIHNQPLNYSAVNKQDTFSSVPAGISLLGQQVNAYNLDSTQAQWIFGIRLKPFSFLKQNFISSLEAKNTLESVTHLLSQHPFLFALLPLLEQLSEQTLQTDVPVLIKQVCPWLHSQFIANDFIISPILRAQTNAILTARGDIQISDICHHFSVSKVTLRQHFLNNIGLLPKELCKIWRLNNFLLETQNHQQTLTDSAINAGYFDQAHLNREFKSLLGQTPKTYLQSQSYQNNLAVQASINKRFVGEYDPF